MFPGEKKKCKKSPLLQTVSKLLIKCYILNYKKRDLNECLWWAFKRSSIALPVGTNQRAEAWRWREKLEESVGKSESFQCSFQRWIKVKSSTDGWQVRTCCCSHEGNKNQKHFKYPNFQNLFISNCISKKNRLSWNCNCYKDGISSGIYMYIYTWSGWLLRTGHIFLKIQLREWIFEIKT